MPFGFAFASRKDGAITAGFRTCSPKGSAQWSNKSRVGPPEPWTTRVANHSHVHEFTRVLTRKTSVDQS
jgi:hypothetical protein